MQKLDVRLTVKQSGDGDWWCIVRADAGNGARMVSMGPGAMRFDLDERLGRGDSNCDIEGTADEMLAIAGAIVGGGEVSFRRCSAKTMENGVLLESPRNSVEPVLVPRACAMALADEIVSKVKGPTDG